MPAGFKMRLCAFLLILYLFFPSVSVAQKAGAISIKNTQAPEMFKLYQYPAPTPTASFLDENERKVSLHDFKGKILLVNIWSTSCTQCIVELPMLDRLQKDMGGMKFQVIAISSDMETPAALKKFWIAKGLKNLKIYMDPQARYAQAARVLGMPTTFLINEDGREIGRIRGIAEWDGVKIKAQIRDLIRQAKEKSEVRNAQAAVVEITPVPEVEKDPLRTDSVPPPPYRPQEEISGWFKK